jgi:hypothetical protein
MTRTFGKRIANRSLFIGNFFLNIAKGKIEFFQNLGRYWETPSDKGARGWPLDGEARLEGRFLG